MSNSLSRGFRTLNGIPLYNKVKGAAATRRTTRTAVVSQRKPFGKKKNARREAEGPRAEHGHHRHPPPIEQRCPSSCSVRKPCFLRDQPKRSVPYINTVGFPLLSAEQVRVLLQHFCCCCVVRQRSLSRELRLPSAEGVCLIYCSVSCVCTLAAAVGVLVSSPFRWRFTKHGAGSLCAEDREGFSLRGSQSCEARWILWCRPRR